MTASDFVRALASSAWKAALGILGWLVIAPVAFLLPRRRDWIAVIGREQGQFVDNAKYFFLQGADLLGPEIKMVFISERQDVVDLIKEDGYRAMRYPSAQSICLLLRCGVAIVDSSEWHKHFRRFLLVRAKLVQLWHGVGFKRIGLDHWKHQARAGRVLALPGIRNFRIAMHIVSGRLVRYDLVNTTSTFYRDEVFKGAFASRQFSVLGYPRNTFGILGGVAEKLAWTNVDRSITNRVAAWREAGRRIVLVAPTFRDSRAAPMDLSESTIAMLDDFCEATNAAFVFKFHPFERNASQVGGNHLHLSRSDCDLYPLMPIASALITDYSSIYMDFLLVDKPVLFLVPDLQEYVRQDRQIQFDFNDMTPGPKLDSWKSVIDALVAQWHQDTYRDTRAKLRRMAFDDLPQSQAVPGLIELMRVQGWIRESSTNTSHHHNSVKERYP